MSENFFTSEGVAQNRWNPVLTWLESNGLIEEAVSHPGEILAQEDLLKWAQGVLPSAATGAATGMAAGPWGALIGGLTGLGLGALQMAQQQQRPNAATPAPSRPAAPSGSGPVSGVLRPAEPPAASPAPSSPAAPPGPGQVFRVPSPVSPSLSSPPQLLQLLGQLLPLLTQLLSQQSRPRARGEASIESNETNLRGDHVPDEDFLSGDGTRESKDHSIEGPIPQQSSSQAQAQEVETLPEQQPAPEYPLASRFVPAAEGNFRRFWGTPTNPNRQIRRIVIHITDGGPNINGTISWFRNPAARVSAHYIVGQNGEVVQMVRHNDIAWHARRANVDSIGIEHVANTRGLNPTPSQYASSAALVRWLCELYGIPMDRAHILGHSEADPTTTHTRCPNAVWDWSYYMSMVTSGMSLQPPTAAVSEALKEAAAAESKSQEKPFAECPSFTPGVPEIAAEWSAEAFIEQEAVS